MTGFAVMEDDTVLCADCVHEICDDRLPASAGTLVHAWLAAGLGPVVQMVRRDRRSRRPGRGWVMNGQGMIGRDCAWCGLPAVGEIDVQPAQHRTVTRRDPVTGKRTSHQAFVRAAIVVPACTEHQHITTGQPAPVAVPRQRTARDVEQLGMFTDGREERLRNAIYRERGR